MLCDTPRDEMFATAPTEARGEGIEPSSPGSKPGSLPLTDPRISKSALRESNPPRQVGSLEPLPLGQGHVLHQSCGGRNRTCVRAVNSRLPVPTRVPPHHVSQDDWIRTSDLVLPKHAEYQAFLRPEFNKAESGKPKADVLLGFPLSPFRFWKSAQRELNPHFRHGRAVGCRYIMGAFVGVELSKIQEHREGLEPSSPHYECGVLAAGRPVLVAEVGPVGLEPTPTRLRAGNAAANTLVPSTSRHRSRRGGSRTLDLDLIRVLLSPLSYTPRHE